MGPETKDFLLKILIYFCDEHHLWGQRRDDLIATVLQELSG